MRKTQYIQIGGATQLDTLTSLFTKFCDFLNGTSWFQLVQWPFWCLVIILALGGVYTARFGKRKLLTLGIQGALKLAILYMVATAGYVWAPSVMAKLSHLPFLTVSDEALTLLNPVGLLFKLSNSLPQMVVRLYFLLFFINAVSVFDYNPPNFISWFFFQLLFGGFALLIYAAVSFFIVKFWPGSNDLLYISLMILLLVVFTLILVFKFVFTFVVTGGNATFQSVYTFLTNQKFGLLFSVTAISFMIVVVYLVAAGLFGHARLELGSFNTIAYLLNGLMCTLTLYVFCRYYNG